jgi:hypothetical protein
MARPRRAPDPWNIGFGAIGLCLALATLLFWLPNDVGSGFLKTNRVGIQVPGDAFFPVLLAWALLLLSALQMLGAWRDRTEDSPGTASSKLTTDNFRFLVFLYAVVLVGLALMYWLGPAVTGLLRRLGMIDGTYRELLDTVPYKYIGYVAGGFTMVLGLIARAEGRVRPRAVLTVVIVLAALILIFDVSLKNVALPPNLDY